jgi:hypothetical protein
MADSDSFFQRAYAALFGGDSPAPSTDPRHQYVPGQMAKSHSDPNPSFATAGQAQDWTQQRFNGLPLTFDGEPGPWRDAGAAPPFDEWRARQNVDAFQHAAGPLARAYDAGVTMPSSLHVEREGISGSFKPGTASMAFYRPKDASMHLNEDFINRGNQNSVDETVLHELGHVNDPNIDRWSWGTTLGENQDRETAAKISKYAAFHPDEFIAETYARGANGAPLPADIAKMYAERHGPSIPRLTPSALSTQDMQLENIRRQIAALGGQFSKE